MLLDSLTIDDIDGKAGGGRETTPPPKSKPTKKRKEKEEEKEDKKEEEEEEENSSNKRVRRGGGGWRQGERERKKVARDGETCGKRVTITNLIQCSHFYNPYILLQISSRKITIINNFYYTEGRGGEEAGGKVRIFTLTTWMGNCNVHSVYSIVLDKKVQKQDLKNIKNVKRCRDGMPKSMKTR